MATTSIRTAAKSALVTAIQAALPTTQVAYGWPGADYERDCVYVLGPYEGQVGFPVAMAGRKQRDDIFRLVVEAYSYVPGDSLLEAEQQVETLYAAFESVLAADQTLGNLDGVLMVLYGPNVLGPNSSLTDEGAQAAMTTSVTVHSRLS